MKVFNKAFYLLYLSLVLTYSEYSFGLAAEVDNASWQAIQSAKDKKYKKYIKENYEEYDWFANFANGYTGVPYILLRSFPDLAPEIWGEPDEYFSKFGFFQDTDNPSRPLPIGLGWVSVDHKYPSQYDPKNPSLHVVTLTCGACHIGRVRVSENHYKHLVGAPNTQIDVRKWRRAFELTVEKYLKDDEKIEKTSERIVEIIKNKPANFFYKNYENFSSDAEQSQRDLFAKKEVVQEILKGFATNIKIGRAAVLKQMHTSYGKKNAPPLDGGSPGQSDGSGDLIPKLVMHDYLTSKADPKNLPESLREFEKEDFPELPRNLATVTDILGVWKQEDKPLAQIDGSVKSPFFRNIAAIVAIVTDPKQTNYVNADFSARFTYSLPPPAYPFSVDMNRAKIGEKLFAENCGICHRPQNKTIYRNLGTDFNRARVLNDAAFNLFSRNFLAAAPLEYTYIDSLGKK